MKKLLLLLLPLSLGALVLNGVLQIQPILHTIQRGISTAMGSPMTKRMPLEPIPMMPPKTQIPKIQKKTTDPNDPDYLKDEEGGNRTPVVENVTAAQIEGTKAHGNLL